MIFVKLQERVKHNLLNKVLMSHELVIMKVVIGGTESKLEMLHMMQVL